MTTLTASSPSQKLPEKTSSSPTVGHVRGWTVVPPPPLSLLRALPEQNSPGLSRGNLQLPVNVCRPQTNCQGKNVHQCATRRPAQQYRVEVHPTRVRQVSRQQPRSRQHRQPISLTTMRILFILTMNSTTLIPKCSSTIVFSPTLAQPRSSKMRGYGAFTINST